MVQTDTDLRALVALLNLLIHGAAAWACVCRISTMSAQTTTRIARAGYAGTLTCCIAVATLPLWGTWPSVGEIISGAAILLLIAGSRGAWANGPPPHARRKSGTDRPGVVIVTRTSGWLVMAPAIIALLFAAPMLEASIRGPIQRDWTVTEWHTVDGDVVLMGHMTKWWSCDWRPPNRASQQARMPAKTGRQHAYPDGLVRGALLAAPAMCCGSMPSTAAIHFGRRLRSLASSMRGKHDDRTLDPNRCRCRSNNSRRIPAAPPKSL